MQPTANKIADLKLSKPAHRALVNGGITTLKQLSKFSEKEILKLHGIGKTALPVMKQSLKLNGLSFTKK
jgi:DNA-directed RNA polymerase alpha subunit